MTDSALPVTPVSPAAPEHVHVDDEQFGSHLQHWQIIGLDDDEQRIRCFTDSLEQAVVPAGLDGQEPQDFWLICGLEAPLRVVQLIELAQGKPSGIRNAYPMVDSARLRRVQIERVISCEAQASAILQLRTEDDTTLYAFDTLFAVNQQAYRQQVWYEAALGALAYDLQRVTPGQVLDITDPAAIRHHRALNSILAARPDIPHEQLQQALHDWQPQSADDERPLQINLSDMVAYLHGDHFGQQDEAWIQGEIIGCASLNWQARPVQLLDVVIQRGDDAGSMPLVIQIIHANPELIFSVGDKICGNIWLQAAIYDKYET